MQGVSRGQYLYSPAVNRFDHRRGVTEDWRTAARFRHFQPAPRFALVKNEDLADASEHAARAAFCCVDGSDSAAVSINDGDVA